MTGHRDLCAGDAALTDAIAEALTGIDSRRRAGTSATPVGLAIVSALAEGADRIVARLAMLRGASLEVVLPMPPGDYLTDFKSPSSQGEFDTLLARATTVTELAWAGERDEAYERAGRVILTVRTSCWPCGMGRPPAAAAVQPRSSPTPSSRACRC